VQHKTLSLPPLNSAPTSRCILLPHVNLPSQTDVIDAHNMAIIAHLWKMLGKIQAESHYLLPGVTPLECLPPSYGVFSPPYSAKPIPQLISLSHFATYPAFSFNLFVARLTLPSSLHASSLSFLQIRYFNLIRFNRAHLHPFARLRHTFFVDPTNFASTNSIIPYFAPNFRLCSHINSVNSAFFRQQLIFELPLTALNLSKPRFILPTS
jgi:hypothetical protein